MLMSCEGCGDGPVWICRVRGGMATYWCVGCMNEEMNKGHVRGDHWMAVSPS